MKPPPANSRTSTPEEVRLVGVLERILFANEDNGYTVAEFRLGDGGETLTITGSLPSVQCGETLDLSGQWSTHPQHGRQFRVLSFVSKLPSTVYGIRKFLGSGLVPGIGKVYAEKIVDRFKERTLEVISGESARLCEVEGIGPKRVKAIREAWEQQAALRDVMVTLQSHGVTVGLCLKLVKHYGAAAPEVLRREPYRVAREIPGIGFKTADRIALNLRVANDSPERVDAGILHLLGEAEEDGHAAFPEEDLERAALELLGSPREVVRGRLEQLKRARELIGLAPAQEGEVGAVVPLLQLPPLHRFEGKIAAAMARLRGARSELPAIRVEAAVTWAGERAGFAFAEAQAEGLRRALDSTVSVLTGGPGTGKTTILRALVAILKAKKARVHLAAPTGRAAQRLAEATGGYAQTIHRLLRFEPTGGGFQHNESRPLSTDFLIVDEASMLDTRLASALLSAVPAGAHLLLVGDTDQLPSVGAGQVLQDIIASGVAPVTRLSRIYRQREGSLIIDAAHAANEGRVLLPRLAAAAADLDWSRDFLFLAAEDAEDCCQKVVEVVAALGTEGRRWDRVREVQVLSPMHKGAAGVGNLNQKLQEKLNGEAQGLRLGSVVFRPGDKVIQLRNNYDKGIFNGDLGFVRSVDGVAGSLVAEFDGQPQSFDRSDLTDLALAYAISIHKSQGSEYPVVVVPLVKAHFVMLTRNLLYTAITRGKRQVIVVGDTAAYAMAVRNQDTRVRWTDLRRRLLAAEARGSAAGRRS